MAFVLANVYVVPGYAALHVAWLAAGLVGLEVEKYDQVTALRDVSGVNVSAGKTWIGRHCMKRVRSLDSLEKMLGGSVVRAFD